MAERPAIQLTIEQAGLARIGERLKAEEGGMKLRRQLAARLRAAISPAVAQIKSNAAAMHSQHLTARGEGNLRHKLIEAKAVTSLGAAIAAGITAQVRFSGRATGVSVRARKKGMPRDFANAPKRMNSRSFRHRIFGRDVWTVQVGAPGYFDKPLRESRVVYRAACAAELQAMADRIAK